jgi:hypothetical protein
MTAASTISSPRMIKLRVEKTGEDRGHSKESNGLISDQSSEQNHGRTHYLKFRKGDATPQPILEKPPEMVKRSVRQCSRVSLCSCHKVTETREGCSVCELSSM